MKILVYGAGSWGTALANVLADNNQQVYLYGNIPEVVDEINLKHTNSTYFGNETLINDKIIGVKSYLPYLNEVDILIIAVPTKAYREVLSQINLELEKKLYIVSVGKGFDPTTEKRLSETIRELIDESKRYPIVSLIGPSHAEEVILRKLTCLTSTCLDLSTGQLIQNFSHGSSLFVLAPTASSAVGFGVVWAFCCSRAASCSGVRFATRTISATSTFSASAIRRSSSSMRLFSWMRRSLARARSARSLSSFSLIVHLRVTWESCQNPAGVCPNNLNGCSSI